MIKRNKDVEYDSALRTTHDDVVYCPHCGDPGDLSLDVLNRAQFKHAQDCSVVKARRMLGIKEGGVLDAEIK